ncbi:restriction endonuclease subunit S [Vibrio cholerae]
MSWPMVKLGDLVSVKGGKRLPLGAGYSDIETPYPYIRVTDFENHSVNTSNVLFISEDVQQKIARYTISSEDVYISIAGSIGIVGIVPEELNGANLTENAAKLVITDKSKLDKNYLMRFLATAGQSQLHSQAKTTSQPKLALFRIEDVEIPLPPLAEQKRIAAILDKADVIRRKRQQAIQLADEFLRAVFLEMFGDPVTNPKGWEVLKFEAVGKLDRGKSKHRPRNDPKLLGGEHPLIQTGDVANSGGYIKIYSSTYSDFGLAQSRKWPAGTLCITIAANIAKTGILTFDACFPDSVVGFTPNKLVTTEYVQMWLGFLQKILENSAPESAQKNINLEILRGLTIPVPPIELQSTFSSAVEKMNSVKEIFDSGVSETNCFFSSLSQKAFSGQL